MRGQLGQCCHIPATAERDPFPSLPPPSGDHSGDHSGDVQWSPLNDLGDLKVRTSPPLNEGDLSVTSRGGRLMVVGDTD